MHLLRIRSEVLDVMNLRLDWEDQRLAVWGMRAEILGQLKILSLRSSWSKSLYDSSAATASTESLNASPQPASRGTGRTPESIYPSVLSSPARARRRKTADEISTVVQGIAARLRTFRKDIFPIPAVTLDRMIECSTKKLPDIFLDEQDKLEDETRPLDTIDKFVPALQMQWRKCVILIKLEELSG